MKQYLDSCPILLGHGLICLLFLALADLFKCSLLLLLQVGAFSSSHVTHIVRCGLTTANDKSRQCLHSELLSIKAGFQKRCFENKYLDTRCESSERMWGSSVGLGSSLLEMLEEEKVCKWRDCMWEINVDLGWSLGKMLEQKGV